MRLIWACLWTVPLVSLPAIAALAAPAADLERRWLEHAALRRIGERRGSADRMLSDVAAAVLDQKDKAPGSKAFEARLREAKIAPGAVYLWSSVSYNGSGSRKRLRAHVAEYLGAMQEVKWRKVGAAAQVESCPPGVRSQRTCTRYVLLLHGSAADDKWQDGKLDPKRKRALESCGLHGAIWDLRITYREEPTGPKKPKPPVIPESDPPPETGLEIASGQISVSPVGPGLRETGSSFPNVVAVGTDSGFHCTGVFISRKTVLTARHCLPATRILLGNDIRAPLRIVPIRRAVFPGDARVDAALLFLAEQVNVAPRGYRTARDSTAPTALIRLMGFGSNRNAGDGGFGVKRQVDLHIAGWGCDAARAHASGCIPHIEMMVPRSNGRDTCVGDSGGPLFEYYRNDWRLIGITSRPIPGAQEYCGGGGIYVRLDALADWIGSQLDSAEDAD